MNSAVLRALPANSRPRPPDPAAPSAGRHGLLLLRADDQNDIAKPPMIVGRPFSTATPPEAQPLPRARWAGHATVVDLGEERAQMKLPREEPAGKITHDSGSMSWDQCRRPRWRRGRLQE